MANQREHQHTVLNPSLIISVISLLISLFTFYLNNIRVVHSLKVTYLLGNCYKENNRLLINFKAFFQNTGNKTEALISTFVFFDSKNISDFFNQHVDTAFLIKPGDDVIRNYSISFYEDSLYTLSDRSVVDSTHDFSMYIGYYIPITHKRGFGDIETIDVDETKQLSLYILRNEKIDSLWNFSTASLNETTITLLPK